MLVDAHNSSVGFPFADVHSSCADGLVELDAGCILQIVDNFLAFAVVDDIQLFGVDGSFQLPDTFPYFAGEFVGFPTY